MTIELNFRRLYKIINFCLFAKCVETIVFPSISKNAFRVYGLEQDPLWILRAVKDKRSEYILFPAGFNVNF